MRKRLQKAFLLIALFSFSIGFLGAAPDKEVRWADRIVTSADNFYASGVTEPTNAYYNHLILEGTITVSGDVTIAATAADMTVSISKDKVYIQPYNASPTANALEYGQLIFNPLEGRTIYVDTLSDLEFTGSFGTSRLWKSVDMIVTFSGRGQVVFRLSGKYYTVPGGNPIPYRGAEVYFNGYAEKERQTGIYHQASTKVYIVMDQLRDDVLGDSPNGLINKVTFQRYDYLPTVAPSFYNQINPDPTYNTYATGVRIGIGSYITYLSNNRTGEGDLTTNLEGFGSLAFDPTFSGNGRMYLKIDGTRDIKAQNFFGPTNPGLFNDGGIMIFGHYVPDYNAATIRSLVDLNQVAGIKAFFRVIDTLRYENQEKVDPSEAERRGLLIINRNTTVPSLASAPYLENFEPAASPFLLSWINAPTFADTFFPPNPYFPDQGHKQFNVQPGFILGINGWMDVYHRTFVDYVAANICNINSEFFGEFVSTLATAQDSLAIFPYIKTRNPSALFIDNLNPNWNDNQYWVDPDNFPSAYARIMFYGDGRLLMRSGADVYGLINGREIDTAADPTGDRLPYGPWFDSIQSTWVYTFTIDKQPYDGRMINSQLVTSNDGEHVLDVEGAAGIYTRLRNDAPGRGEYTPAVGTEKGVINMPTLSINYTGQEILENQPSMADYIVRPLDKGTSYDIYNSPSMLFNVGVSSQFIGATYIYDTTIEHNDVLKNVTQNPLTSAPAMVGGDVVVFNTHVWHPKISDPDYFEYFEVPKVWMFNSDLNMHESLDASGIRFVTTDLWNYLDPATKYVGTEEVFGTNANNTSVFKFFDHGDQLDMLGNVPYGRIFNAGSFLNKSGWLSESETPLDFTTTSSALESTTIYGFRTNASDEGTEADTIKLSLQSEFDPGAQPYSPSMYPITEPLELNPGRAQHLFLLSRNDLDGSASYVSMGWPYKSKDSEPVGYTDSYPWQDTSAFTGDPISLRVPALATQLPNEYVQPATFSIDGNYIYFGGYNILGTKSPVPVVNFQEGSRIYINHGGRIQATRPTTNPEELDVVNARHGYDAVFDLQLAQLLWKDADDGSTGVLAGVIDLPKDQAIFYDKYATQPYMVNSNLGGSGNIHLTTYFDRYTANFDPTPERSRADREAATEQTIAWDKRAFNPNFIPVKSLGTEEKDIVKDKFGRELTRFTGIVDEPVTLPTDGLMFYTTGDIKDQIKILGATDADPLMLLITGDGGNMQPGWIKEIVWEHSDPEVPGEGDHAAIFLQNGGRVGLGSWGWDEYSAVNAFNKLGKDYVTICPDGFTFIPTDTTRALVVGVVDVNSDLIVADPIAFVPTQNFGAAINGGSENIAYRLVIRSDDAQEIRIPAGQALDLSSFGQAPCMQQIEIGGKLRLIFEEGSTLRFPDDDDVDGGVVLYLNDDAELVFEGVPASQNRRYQNLGDADWAKTKILGSGQIWVNKNAKIEIMAPAQVSIRGDEYTSHTRFAISLQRTGQFMIGDGNQAGGSLEIGNPISLDSGYVDFSLLLGGQVGGAECKFQINRQGFLGLGVGIVNKEASNPNGNAAIENNPVINPDLTLTWNPDTQHAWQVSALHDVRNVLIRVIEGQFYHSNAFRGDDERASLMAISPILEDGAFNFEIADGSNNPNSIVYGGGNIMNYNGGAVRADGDGVATVNIWDYQDVIYPDLVYRDDSTMYGIFAAGFIMGRADVLSFGSTLFPLATITRTDKSGIDFITPSRDEFWRFIAVPPYRFTAYDLSLSTDTMITLGTTPFDRIATYVGLNGTTIVRLADPDVVGGTVEQALDQGVLMGADESLRSADGSILGPEVFSLLYNSNK
jgi:hypothetical protein